MTTLSEIDKLFDKRFEGYWRGRGVPDELKSFIHQQVKELLEGLKMEGYKLFPEEGRNQTQIQTEKDLVSGYNQCVKELNSKIAEAKK